VNCIRDITPEMQWKLALGEPWLLGKEEERANELACLSNDLSP